MNAKAIGGRVRELRRAAGLSQESLAAAAGIDRSTLAKIETGSRLPDLPTVVSLAEALGVSVSTITQDMEAGRAQAKELIARFLQSPWAQTLIPPARPEELARIEEMGDILWTRFPATEQAIQLLILALRADTRGE